MKTFTLFCLLLFGLVYLPLQAQTLCNAGGNVVIFSNYDGGVLNVNVDVNVPNLKIGICTYERVTVNFSGAFVGNITEVRYAGYDARNNHCGSTAATLVTGVSAGIVSIVIYPPAFIPDPNGWPNILCSYQCTTGNQGGCNTVTQVSNYFTTVFGGTLRSHFTQYGCWTAKTISGGGNCCLTAASLPTNIAQFEASLQGQKVRAAWKTDFENDIRHFSLEKSYDAFNFTTVADIPAKGNISSGNTYVYEDLNPSKEMRFYRLNWQDKDGQHYYSETKEVNFNTLETFNPIIMPRETGYWDISWTGDKTIVQNVQVINAMGQVVYQHPQWIETLDLSGYPKGVYYLRWITPSTTKSVTLSH